MNERQKEIDHLQERLIDFAVRIIKLSSKLPKIPAGRHVAGQVLRSETSPAANYGEARAASSHADFIHHLSVVLSELNETHIWLKIILKSELLEPALLSGIVDENQQLCRIFTASIKTARTDALNKTQSKKRC
jgi:four helix bundle protein